MAQDNTKTNRPQIDKEKTLAAFTKREIKISGWCRGWGIDRGRLYAVINDKGLKRRDCYAGKKAFEALKADGLLVLKDTGSDVS